MVRLVETVVVAPDAALEATAGWTSGTSIRAGVECTTTGAASTLV
jgi:hypothetical protein